MSTVVGLPKYTYTKSQLALVNHTKNQYDIQYIRDSPKTNSKPDIKITTSNSTPLLLVNILIQACFCGTKSRLIIHVCAHASTEILSEMMHLQSITTTASTRTHQNL